MYETQAVENPQLDRQDSHRITSRSKPPFFWKKVTIFLGLDKFVRQSDASKHSNMLKQFDELKALDNYTRQKLRSEVITYQKQLATLNILIKGGQIISRWLLLLMLVLIWITAFRVAPLALNVKYSIPDSITAVLLLILVILAYSVLMGIFMLPSILNVNSAKVLFVWHFTVSFIYALLLFSVLVPWGHSSSNVISYSIVVALTGNIEYEIVYIIVITVFIVFGRIAVERWYTVRYPLAMLIRYLIDVVYSIEQRRGCRIDLQEKQRQLSGLEIVARCIEWYLPRQLSGGDVITDTWWKEMTREVANALRDKKRWILTPKEDTQNWLIRSLVSTLVCVLNGDWDGLERIKDNDIAHPHLWLSHMFHMLALFIEATLPILAFLIFQRFFSLSTPAHDYIIVGLFLWVLITVIGSLDPKFSDKVAAIKEVTSIITPAK